MTNGLATRAAELGDDAPEADERQIGYRDGSRGATTARLPTRHSSPRVAPGLDALRRSRETNGTSRFLKVEEAARALAIGRSTAYELANAFLATGGREGLPVIRLGRSLRVPASVLERWSAIEHLARADEFE